MGLMTALSLQFFMFILVIFLVELSAAILAFIFREHVCTPQLSTLLPLPSTELWGLPQRASLSYLSHVLCHKPGRATAPSPVKSPPVGVFPEVLTQCCLWVPSPAWFLEFISNPVTACWWLAHGQAVGEDNLGLGMWCARLGNQPL